MCSVFKSEHFENNMTSDFDRYYQTGRRAPNHFIMNIFAISRSQLIYIFFSLLAIFCLTVIVETNRYFGSSVLDKSWWHRMLKFNPEPSIQYSFLFTKFQENWSKTEAVTVPSFFRQYGRHDVTLKTKVLITKTRITRYLGDKKLKVWWKSAE